MCVRFTIQTEHIPHIQRITTEHWAGKGRTNECYIYYYCTHIVYVYIHPDLKFWLIRMAAAWTPDCFTAKSLRCHRAASMSVPRATLSSCHATETCPRRQADLPICNLATGSLHEAAETLPRRERDIFAYIGYTLKRNELTSHMTSHILPI